MEQEKVITILNEDVAFYTAIVLNHEYPNVEFEGTENGSGQYDIKVKSKYEDRPIHPHTMKQFQNKAWEVMRTVGMVLHYQMKGVVK